MKQQKNKRFKKAGRETAQRKTIPSFPISVIAPVSMYSEVKEKGLWLVRLTFLSLNPEEELEAKLFWQVKF